MRKIFIALLVVVIGLALYLHSQRESAIIAIVQRGSEREFLDTDSLAELMGLSVDETTNLFTFDTVEAEKKLLKSPLIKKVKVEKAPPNTLYVDYEMRYPIAYIGDQTNTAIDSEGQFLPVDPYFTPKNLPTIFVGEANHIWGNKWVGEKATLALKLLTFPMRDDTFVKTIDVSNAFAASYGKREIVIYVETYYEHEENFYISPRYLRLATDSYTSALNNYPKLAGYLAKYGSEGLVIDLRLPQLAFLKSINGGS